MYFRQPVGLPEKFGLLWRGALIDPCRIMGGHVLN